MSSGPSFFQFRRAGSFVPVGAWAMVMVPGILMILFAIAILVWPQLLAYMVASVILVAGVSMVGWALTLRRAAKAAQERMSRNVSGNVDVEPDPIYDDTIRSTGSRTVIYREL